jgi:hydroxyacylglutathione hydrolase
MRTAAALLLVLLASGCAARTDVIQDPPRSRAVISGGPWDSMIYIARTGRGVVVIDLGWIGADGTIRRALGEIGAVPEEVAAVFLTHSHRDHITGWRQLRAATFHMAAPEVARFTGVERHRGRIPRIAERLVPSDRPSPGELDVRGFSRDTIFALGSDTLRAFLLPGHTAGSAAYLFRGVLFVGDAISWSMLSGFRPDRPIHSDDSGVNRAALESLWGRLPDRSVRWVCTAHAKCARYTPDLVAGARR